jgi:hypothetical protein
VDEPTTGDVGAASGFETVTEFGNWMSQYVGLFSGDDHQLVI